MTHADELHAAAAKLRAFAASDEPVALCYDCGVRGAPEPDLETLLAAREPLAAWLEGIAKTYSGVRSGSRRKPPAHSNLAHALTIARAINGSDRG